jgi:hypothetical protein
MELISPFNRKTDMKGQPRYEWYVAFNYRLYGTNSFHDALFFAIKYNAQYMESAKHPSMEYL